MIEQSALQRNDQDYRLFALAALRAKEKPWAVLTTEDVSNTLGISPKQTARLFTRLLAKKRIQQLRRGLYIAPSRPPPGKLWTPSPYEALWAYMNWLGATWQITGYAAFTRFGFSTQVIQRMEVYNDKLAGETNAGGSQFLFIKVPKNQLGFTTEFPMSGNINIPFSSRPRILFDAVAEPKRFAILPEAYTWFTEIIAHPDEIEGMKTICLQIGARQTVARIGFILEYLGIDASILLPKLNNSLTLVPLIPGKRIGTINKRWGIIENIQLKDIFFNLEVPDADE